jgi:hypothetical protein
MNHNPSNRRTTFPIDGLLSGFIRQQSTKIAHMESVKIVGKYLDRSGLPPCRTKSTTVMLRRK